MNNHRTKQYGTTRLAAVALLALGTAAPLFAASLEPRIEIRPLTPQEKKDYKLTTLQVATGLSTVGLGQPAHLEALVNGEVPATDIVKVTWSLTGSPIGSSATLAESPLGADVPTYKMSDRERARLVGRTFLRPDVEGQYTITAAIETTSGTTNLTQTITAARYVGLTTCAYCHSGGLIASNTVVPWMATKHAHIFTREIDGTPGGHYSQNCISCHTVGYDANTNAVNGGFDDVAKQLGWTFPKEMTNGNWAAMPKELQNLANIQCENCHGPGSQHASSLGKADKISKTFASADCAHCHDSLTHHFRPAEWNNSRHAIAVQEESTSCVGCHQGPGFADRAAGVPEAQRSQHYEAIGCAACHDPHDATNPHQLRMVGPVTLMDKKTTITEGGNGLLCMNCHMSRRDAKTYAETTAGSNRFGPHHGPQADMLAGANAYTYDKVIASSAHRDVVEDSCVTCHMQPRESGDPGFTHVGGHTFNLAWEGEGTNAPVHLVEACVECHGEIENFDFVRQDYDNDGVLEGVQTEVRGLLDKLAYMLPPVGVAKTNHSPSNIAINNTWSRPHLKAAYNYLFVVEDGSYGIHNLSYAVGLLKASIADLSGDANNDTLPDAWQVQYFGSYNDPMAAPNACPAGDGVPNWMKYNLGLDPKVPGMALPTGVVWTNGKQLTAGPINPGDTNVVAIFTAAEVAFTTEAGKNYQIQACSSLSGGWQNIGQPIAGTGSTVSYVTPTRKDAQQFFRVIVQ